MQEAQSRRQMKEQRRGAAELEPDHLHSFNALSASELISAVRDVSVGESSLVSDYRVAHTSTAVSVEAASNEPHIQHRTTVAKNRRKQLQQWAAARPTVPITCSYFTAPPDAGPPLQESPTRVLLSGLGADELCGGYARYLTAYRRGGEDAARASMKADVDRIWLRNLGRDDRFYVSENADQHSFIV